jgi:hypothetical protein
MKLWPECPFTFRVCTNGGNTPAHKYLKNQPNVELISSNKQIKHSMVKLLEGIPNDEWVFWCTDDRYPISINRPHMNAICNAIKDNDPVLKDINRIKLLQVGEAVTRQKVLVDDVVFLKQKEDGRPHGFWKHYFVRAGILRRTFVNNGVPNDYNMSTIQTTVLGWNAKGIKLAIPKKDIHTYLLGKTIIPARTVAGYGEPCLRNQRLTKNGGDALKQYNCFWPPGYKAISRNLLFTGRNIKV